VVLDTRLATCLALIVAHAAHASAQVIEPNGVSVPLAPAGSTEQSLQAYFDARMPPEAIDAVADASAEPSTFSPLCGFEAELVMSQSSSPAGLAWYNVPDDANAAPSATYPILTETTATGATISSAAIRQDPNYAGGLIGFALTKFSGQPIYYSEPARNAECTACSMPGHWTLMLAYPSSLEPTTYYLAWEDWEGANESNWPDDGDFNDKVFRLGGVRCAGGGDACDTGKPGVCASGLTDCGTSSDRACKQVTAATVEQCDGLDNDCNGVIDDGGKLCTGNLICVRGRCTTACDGDEFHCSDGKTCEDGRCVESACAGVHCDAGLACRAGQCVAPCDGVVCPLGQVCSAGICADPCAGAKCGAGSVCRGGACVEVCSCAGCPSGLACDVQSGECVDQECEGVRCSGGMRCNGGDCVDPCMQARCPGGVACVEGECRDPNARPAQMDAGEEDQASAGAGAAEVAHHAGSMRGAMRDPEDAQSGCACRMAHGTRSSPSLALWLTLSYMLVFEVVRARSRARAGARARKKTR
jgi:hypothetical protein